MKCLVSVYRVRYDQVMSSLLPRNLLFLWPEVGRWAVGRRTVGHEAAKVAANNAVPCRSLALIELKSPQVLATVYSQAIKITAIGSRFA